ncbi:hypothetical protein CH299_25680 [Rhodococcus sp. 14-2686-1-2]|nr:hypothetical protein CH301_25160 [Rhodococcus sp. 15-1189-1-1a]OZF08983.1 hypothetical protein CH299_25680 [Rhodococcus sp. 14-2686-1-2]
MHVMAIIHAAELTPSKRDALRAWLPTRPWATSTDVDILGTYRFDDPTGAVGIETFLISTGGRVLQVPITYRGAPLSGSVDSLVTTMEHSVLGTRWAYDGVADPVYVTALAAAILTGGTEAALEYDYQAPPEKRAVTTRVVGTGTPGTQVPAIDSVSSVDSDQSTNITAGTTRIDLVRVVDTTRSTAAGPSLTGTWPDQSDPVVLAWIRPHEH